MGYDDEKSTAIDPDDPAPDEVLTAEEYNNLVDVVGQNTTNIVGNDTDISNLQSRTTTLENEAARRSELYEAAAQIYVAPDGDDSNDGRSPRNAVATYTRAAEIIRNSRGTYPIQAPPASINVDSGVIPIDNPVKIPKDVSVLASDLKSCRVEPNNPKLDYFHCDSQQYFEGIRFYDHRWPAFCFSFPRAIVETEVVGGSVVDATLLYSPEGYLQGSNSATPTPLVDPPAIESGTRATISIDSISGGTIDSVSVTNGGSDYQERPNVSIPAPESKQPFVIASPYPQNCSSVTGPYDINGKEIPPTVPLPYDTENGFTYDGESYAPVAQKGAGGGIIIDGRLPYGRNDMTPISSSSDVPQSPLNSFVTAQFTQVNQGGPGHLLINSGFGQFVSSFTTFSTYSYKAKTGGNALLSNSVSDFGNKGLVAEGRDTDEYSSGQIKGSRASTVAGITISDGGSGYSTASVTIDDPVTGPADTATADPVIENGTIAKINVTDDGANYESVPSVSISGDGSGATAEAQMDRVGTVVVDDIAQVQQPGSTIDATPRAGTVCTIGGRSREPFITTWTQNTNGTYEVSFQPGLLSVDDGDDVGFYEVSQINSGAHLFEYPGTGITYNALPQYGGKPERSVIAEEYGVGRVFHTSSDERGNFYVGDQFSVDQATGKVTLNTDDFNLSGVNAIGPFNVNGVSVGVQLREVSDRDSLLSNSGLPGNTVPTVRAVRAYLSDNYADDNHDNADHSVTFAEQSELTDVSESGTTTESEVSDINFEESGAATVTVTDDGDGSVSVDVSATDTDTDTHADVSDDGTLIVSDVEDINFGTDVSVQDDGDGSVTIVSDAATDPHGNSAHSKRFIETTDGTAYNLVVDGTDGPGVLNVITQ